MPAPRRTKARAASIPALRSIPWGEVLDNLTDAVLLLAADGSVITCNPAGELLLGHPEKQLHGRAFESLFPDNPEIRGLVRRTQESCQTQAVNDDISLRGRSLTVRMVCSALLDDGDRLRAIAVVVHDLSQQRALREDIERAERLAQLGAVAAGLAHEIKNPLAGIKGAAQLLRRDFAEQEAICEYAEVMIREADRLTGLLDQLLSLGSPAPVEVRELNIHRLIQDVLLLVREAPNAKGVFIECDFDPTLPPILGDERKLKQVLLNLIANALDASNGAGTITLTTRIETDFHIVRGSQRNARLIRIEVADTGSGIAPEHQSHIFDPFFSTKPKGTGLGLAISHRIVSEHGGTLHAASRPRGGTLMTLNLPVAKEGT